MYVNGKKISFESTPGMGGGGKMENGREGEFKYDVCDTLKELF
jgi:hypothetical protein